MSVLVVAGCSGDDGAGGGTSVSGSSGSTPSGSAQTTGATTTTSASAATSSSTGGNACGEPSSPSWLVGHPLHAWFPIPGTEGAGGINVAAYSGIAFRESTNEIVIAASGGHGDGSDNSVVTLALAVDAPSWVVRHGPSPEVAIDVSHYADGLPSARHVYHSNHVIEPLHRVFLFGARFVYGSAVTFPDVDAFDLDTNTWDPAGTWEPMPHGAGYGAVHLRTTDDVFSTSLWKWTAADQTWSNPVTTRTDDAVRWPIAHDTKRNQLFTLQWGDGQGFDPQQLSASRIPVDGTTQVHVAFAASSALDQLVADKPAYAGMDYDPDGDRFFFYSGTGTTAGRVYVVTPNDGDTWDVSILTLDPASATPPPTPDAGVYNRFRYVPALKGFMLLPNNTDPIYFLRTC